MNGNYLFPFATLSKHYFNIGNILKANYYKELALKVATDSEYIDEYKKYFSEK
jgi:hypothetical protein